jgi:hypothetical protein
METGCGVLLRDECDNRAFSLNPPSSALAYAYQANKYPINIIQQPIRISSCLAQRHGLFHLIVYKLKHTHQVNNKILMKDLTCRPILPYILERPCAHCCAVSWCSHLFISRGVCKFCFVGTPLLRCYIMCPIFQFWSLPNMKMRFHLNPLTIVYDYHLIKKSFDLIPKHVQHVDCMVTKMQEWSILLVSRHAAFNYV